ncbi:MAG TPA: glycosyltransferase [Gaiellaceae bacterium]|nr:glycosyltransferase [Gaiellaceae bacterium]
MATEATGARRDAPGISIIIPAFNQARFLESTLRSVQAQSLTCWECVVVDDGSTDETFAIASRFAASDRRIRAIRIENNGASAARNAGYALTDPSAEFVTFMDSDDVWLPHALETLKARLEADPAAIGAHGLAEMVDESGKPVSDWDHAAFGRKRLGLERNRLIVWPADRPTSFEVLVNGNVLFPPGLVLTRRNGYERAGRFDEQLNGPEDWDMLIRLSRYGYLSFVDVIILRYRRHESNLGARSGIEHQAWLVRCKGFYSPENDAAQRLIARRGWRAYQRMMIGERYRTGLGRIRDGKVRQGFGELARIPVHLFRFAKGYPTPRLVRASEAW